MIHLLIPYAVASVLVGLGLFGVLSRRNAVLVLVGIELILSGALILLVTSGLGETNSVLTHGRWAAASVAPLFVLTIAAAEVVVALAIILALFRARGSIDMDSGSGAGQATSGAAGATSGGAGASSGAAEARDSGGAA